MYKNVIFLDFDGPLFPKRSYLMEANKSYIQTQKCKELNLHPYITYWKMDEMAIGMLNNISEDNNIFVFSTSWNKLHDEATLINLMRQNGFLGFFHQDSFIPTVSEKNRAQNIKDWLIAHPEFENKYIILDDEESAPEMKKPDLMKMYGLDPSRIFLADVDNGILMHQYHNIMLELSK